MDADLEVRVSRYGPRLHQLVVIPDADVSDAENESGDDVLAGNNTPHDT